MNIAIIGTGRMARQLALGWSRAGHTIFFGSRDPANKGDLLKQTPGATVVTAEAAISAAPLVVLALPFTAVAPFARDQAAALRGKLVVDISNPFDHLPDNRLAGAELTAQAIGPGARVLAAFKDNFWNTLLEPRDPVYNLVRDVHFAGDDVDDKQILALLIEDLGFRPIDCGPLKNARILDGMVPLMLELDRRYASSQGRSSWRLLN
jgi:8-hydroxy-5-deazaflavin:NADPH oxidoreductase